MSFVAWRAAALIALSLLVAACGDDVESPPEAGDSLAATATTPSVAQAAVPPTVDDLRRIAVPVAGVDATVEEMSVPVGWEPLWLVATAVANMAGEGTAALYHREAAGWTEVARLTLDEWRDARQVAVTPDALWLQIGDAALTHPARLFSYDSETFAVRFAVPPLPSTDAQPMLGAADYDGDGLLDVAVPLNVLALCDPCFAGQPVEILRWDGSALSPARLERLPDDAEATLRNAVDLALDLANVGLWVGAAAAIEQARGIDSDAATLRIVQWDAILIERTVAEYRAEDRAHGVPLLAPVMAGDADAAVDLLRGLTADELFGGGRSILDGTPGVGLEVELGHLLVARAAGWLSVQRDLAAGYFLRGLGRYLIDADDTVTIRADVRQAQALRTEDALYAEMSTFLHAIHVPAPGR